MSLDEADIATIVSRVLAELEAPPTAEQFAVNLGHFQVAPGQTILADHMNSSLQRGVPKFASATARDAQWPSPPTGAMCYLTDINYLEVFDNAITGGANSWHVLGGLRMGYAIMGASQVIPNGSVDTLVKLDSVGGAANKPGRAVWNVNGSVTVPVSGTYLVTGGVCWPANSTGERRLYIKRYAGGTWQFAGMAGGSSEINTGAVGSTLFRQSVTAQIACNAADQIGMWVQHSATASLTLTTTAADQARLGVHLLGAD